MSSEFRASLIIPVLNEQAIIESQLEKLQVLRNRGIELVVVDGGSTDGTPLLAKGLADKVVVSARGRGVQMNAGAAVAEGAYLVFLHLDTGLPPTFEESLQHWLESRPCWGFFRVKLSARGFGFRVIERAMNWRSRLTHIGTGDQVLFVSSALFNSIKGYAQIPLMEDIELCKRLRKRVPPYIERICVTTSSRRWEEKGIIRTVLLMWRLRLGYFLGIAPERLVSRYYP